MYILGIESSCDETAAAVVRDGREVLSNVVATQIEEHKRYGGVVPEIASRRHTESISTVVAEAIAQAGLTPGEIDAVAVTFAPGLIGALLVGVNFAKGLALQLGVPLIPVHHLRAHLAANYLGDASLEPPFLCLLVSGGNTLLAEVKDYTRFSVIGRTRDDAAGECFDKSARAMGMDYPGGVNLDRVADPAKAGLYRLPTPRIEGDPYDFSFSGLKTAVVNLVHNAEQKGEPLDVPALAGAVRRKVCDLLIEKTVNAALAYGYTSLAVAGGVSANRELRERLTAECGKRGWRLTLPPLAYCGDNAAMVASQGYYEFAAGHTADCSLDARATLSPDFSD